MRIQGKWCLEGGWREKGGAWKKKGAWTEGVCLCVCVRECVCAGVRLLRCKVKTASIKGEENIKQDRKMEATV